MTLASFVVLVSLLLTSQVYPYVSDVLKNNTPVYEMVQGQILEYLEEEFREQAGEAAEGNAALDTLSSNQQSQLIGKLPMPATIRNALAENNNREIYQLMGVESFSEYLASYLAATVLNAASYVLSFAFLYTLLRLAVYALDLMAKLPVLHAVNKVGGVAVALGFALMAVWLFFLVATAASGTAFGREVLRSVEESRLLSFLYDRNLLLEVVMDIGKIFF